jgi:hypothetical protein
MKLRQLEGDGPERHYVIVLAAGDEAVEELRRVAEREKLTAARVHGIGAFERATLAFFDLEKKEYQPIAVDEQVEVAALLGNVSLAGGEPRVHLHAVLGRRDGSTVAGHLLAGRVRPTLEVFLTESPTHLRRHHDEATGLPLLDLDAT